MPVTRLDPRTALVLVDLQKGIVGLPLAHDAGGVVRRCRMLADRFRARGLPVVLVNVAGAAPGRVEQRRALDAPPPDWTDLVPELGRAASDLLVTKRSWGAFTGTGLDEALRRHGVSAIVLGGIATSIGVETTARQAYEFGFNVALATDAMTDGRMEAHENSVARIFPRLGETGDAASIASLLDAGAPGNGGTLPLSGGRGGPG